MRKERRREDEEERKREEGRRGRVMHCDGESDNSCKMTWPFRARAAARTGRPLLLL